MTGAASALTSQALGTDLTTLGLNLNSHDHLYSTFASPWADSPLKLEDDFISPSCFLQISPPKLVPGALQKFRNETLLFIFYSMPGEEAQVRVPHHGVDFVLWGDCRPMWGCCQRCALL